MIPAIRRLWGVIRDAGGGRTVLEITAREPDVGDMRGALLLSGMLADDSRAITVDIVSDPGKDPKLVGPPGPNGWTPIMVGEADGTRTLVHVIDWTSGRGEKPAIGYIGGTGSAALVAKADAFNFNQAKRVAIFTAVTGTSGIADVAFAPPFAAVPATALPIAANNLLGGIVTADVVAGSLTKAGCKVRVQQRALLTGVTSLLAGATVNVIVVEA